MDDRLGPVLAVVQEVTGVAWTPIDRFASGMQGGAWRVDGAPGAAVLTVGSTDEPQRNPEAAAVVAALRGIGYPTPAWLASGVVDQVAWSLQHLVDGAPSGDLDLALADELVRLVDVQRSLDPPTSHSWDAYVRARAPHAADVSLPTDETVHGDLSVGNVLRRDGRVVGVVDIASAGRGCAASDLLAPAANAVVWCSDPAAIDVLVTASLARYRGDVIAVVATAVVHDITTWYSSRMPDAWPGQRDRLAAWTAHLQELTACPRGRLPT